MVNWLLLTVAVLSADGEIAPIKKRQEPVELRVVAVRTLDDGRLEAEILLTPDPDVELYANPEGEKGRVDVEVTLTVKDGSRVKNETVLPKPNRMIDEAGFRSYYRTGPTKVLVRFTPPMDKTLTLRCTYGAWNSWRSCCLGRRNLEAELKLSQ